MKFKELRNNSENVFTDISTEKYREYVTPLGNFRITKPIALSVSKNGHRILDSKGVSYYTDTRQGFILSWKAKKDKPHFIK